MRRHSDFCRTSIWQATALQTLMPKTSLTRHPRAVGLALRVGFVLQKSPIESFSEDQPRACGVDAPQLARWLCSAKRSPVMPFPMPAVGGIQRATAWLCSAKISRGAPVCDDAPVGLDAGADPRFRWRHTHGTRCTVAHWLRSAKNSDDHPVRTAACQNADSHGSFCAAAMRQACSIRS